MPVTPTMTQEINEWEKENQHNIIGWEIHYGYKTPNKEWSYYDGFSMIFFNMKDGITKEFRRYDEIGRTCKT